MLLKRMTKRIPQTMSIVPATMRPVGFSPRKAAPKTRLETNCTEARADRTLCEPKPYAAKFVQLLILKSAKPAIQVFDL